MGEMHLGFMWGPSSREGQDERKMAMMSDILAIQKLGPIGAMRRASDDPHVLRLGLEALRQDFDMDVVLEGLVAYQRKDQ